MPESEEVYQQKKFRLAEQMKNSNNVRLAKKTSNLFRSREKNTEQYLTVRDFNHVLKINTEEGWAVVEGMTTYEEFVNETLPYGFMPTVVPQLKTITVGGAISGIGIEATSFKYGLVHETVLEMEILLPTGETVICDGQNNTDLFYGFPNSYGTLGYVLRLKITIISVKQFVKIEHKKYQNFQEYFNALRTIERSKIDFLDGVMFSQTELYITVGRFVDSAPWVSDYTYMNIYYRSIQKNHTDYLTTHDYLWRWDTDWFWCSQVIGAHHPLLRLLLGRTYLNSSFYTKLMHWDHTWNISKRLMMFKRTREEWIIQDVDIPIDNCVQYAEFFFKDIDIRPVWICPINAYDKNIEFSLYPLDPKHMYVNFGFWGSRQTDKKEGYYNRLVESKVSELQGKKGLYSDSFYSKEEFWSIYDKSLYDGLKQKYDPTNKLKDLYQKCVERK